MTKSGNTWMQDRQKILGLYARLGSQKTKPKKLQKQAIANPSHTVAKTIPQMCPRNHRRLP